MNLAEANIKQRRLHAARWRTVVADGSKLGRVELAHLCAANDLDLFVTGRSANPDVVAELTECCLTAEIVG